jgi:DNA-directed RNA polymerase subunit RPC12/RpoP
MLKYKCPECERWAEFDEIGLYRSLCTYCGAVVKNQELVIDQKEK